VTAGAMPRELTTHPEGGRADGVKPSLGGCRAGQRLIQCGESHSSIQRRLRREHERVVDVRSTRCSSARLAPCGIRRDRSQRRAHWAALPFGGRRVVLPPRPVVGAQLDRVANPPSGPAQVTISDANVGTFASSKFTPAGTLMGMAALGAYPVDQRERAHGRGGRGRFDRRALSRASPLARSRYSRRRKYAADSS